MCKKCEEEKDEGRCPRCGSLPAGTTPKVGTVCDPCRKARETTTDRLREFEFEDAAIDGWEV